MTVVGLDHKQFVAKEFLGSALLNNFLTRNRKESIAINTNQQHLGLDFLNCLFYRPSSTSNVVRVHGLNKGEVAIGVKATGEFVAVEI